MTILKKTKLVTLKSVLHHQNLQLKLSRGLFVWFYKAEGLKSGQKVKGVK